MERKKEKINRVRSSIEKNKPTECSAIFMHLRDCKELLQIRLRGDSCVLTFFVLRIIPTLPFLYLYDFITGIKDYETIRQLMLFGIEKSLKWYLIYTILLQAYTGMDLLRFLFHSTFI